MVGEVVVRRVEVRDMEPLTGLMFEYIVDFYQRARPPVEQVQALIRVCLEGREGLQFVAECDGQLVGFATLYTTYSTLSAKRAAIMNDLYVVESFRGAGVAEGLFKACHHFTESSGMAYMTWETAHDNYRAQRLYQKMGAQRGEWLTYSI